MKRSTLYHQPAPYPLAHLAPGLAQGVVAVDLKIHLVGMHGQHVGQRLHRRVERYAIALVFKQRIQATEHQRRPPRSQQQPGGVLLAGGDVLVGALLVEGGHAMRYTASLRGCDYLPLIAVWA